MLLSSSVPRGLTAGESFERFDGLARFGHRLELVPDAVGRGSECLVVQEHANSVASRVGRQSIRHELDSGAGGNDAVGVVELIGALWDEQERQAEGECTKSRAGAAMRRDRGAVREQELLRDVPVHMDVRRLLTEHRRVVLRAHRDDNVQPFVAESIE